MATVSPTRRMKASAKFHSFMERKRSEMKPMTSQREKDSRIKQQKEDTRKPNKKDQARQQSHSTSPFKKKNDASLLGLVQRRAYFAGLKNAQYTGKMDKNPFSFSTDSSHDGERDAHEESRLDSSEERMADSRREAADDEGMESNDQTLSQSDKRSQILKSLLRSTSSKNPKSRLVGEKYEDFMKPHKANEKKGWIQVSKRKCEILHRDENPIEREEQERDEATNNMDEIQVKHGIERKDEIQNNGVLMQDRDGISKSDDEQEVDGDLETRDHGEGGGDGNSTTEVELTKSEVIPSQPCTINEKSVEKKEKCAHPKCERSKSNLEPHDMQISDRDGTSPITPSSGHSALLRALKNDNINSETVSMILAIESAVRKNSRQSSITEEQKQSDILRQRRKDLLRSTESNILSQLNRISSSTGHGLGRRENDNRTPSKSPASAWNSLSHTVSTSLSPTQVEVKRSIANLSATITDASHSVKEKAKQIIAKRNPNMNLHSHSDKSEIIPRSNCDSSSSFGSASNLQSNQPGNESFPRASFSEQQLSSLHTEQGAYTLSSELDQVHTASTRIGIDPSVSSGLGMNPCQREFIHDSIEPSNTVLYESNEIVDQQGRPPYVEQKSFTSLSELDQTHTLSMSIRSDRSASSGLGMIVSQRQVIHDANQPSNAISNESTEDAERSGSSPHSERGKQTSPSEPDREHTMSLSIGHDPPVSSGLGINISQRQVVHNVNQTSNNILHALPQSGENPRLSSHDEQGIHISQSEPDQAIENNPSVPSGLGMNILERQGTHHETSDRMKTSTNHHTSEKSIEALHNVAFETSQKSLPAYEKQVQDAQNHHNMDGVGKQVTGMEKMNEEGKLHPIAELPSSHHLHQREKNHGNNTRTSSLVHETMVNGQSHFPRSGSTTIRNSDDVPFVEASSSHSALTSPQINLTTANGANHQLHPNQQPSSNWNMNGNIYNLVPSAIPAFSPNGTQMKVRPPSDSNMNHNFSSRSLGIRGDDADPNVFVYPSMGSQSMSESISTIQGNFNSATYDSSRYTYSGSSYDSYSSIAAGNTYSTTSRRTFSTPKASGSTRSPAPLPHNKQRQQKSRTRRKSQGTSSQSFSSSYKTRQVGESSVAQSEIRSLSSYSDFTDSSKSTSSSRSESESSSLSRSYSSYSSRSSYSSFGSGVSSYTRSNF